ncbi:acyl-CoA dehydrogenase family protein [Streptomyces afghaniensis]|uniref:acyl-CoA dehydrogenase family protein n=1 Tax=Streptomyces afghaniensis TaxID=66865 RepID=UPI002789DE92|nr:acyl-CoA dehydrogenase family protein [Streptomyces afghaniensis]MDQ1020328.1 alkylation response protein AidB-like acyl-CoA dehydrogenase [Streptomyces afghaniensis]
MRFLLDAEQRAFAASLDALLTAADTPAVVRDWSRGDHASGRALWSRLAEAGVFALAVPEAYAGGLGPRPVELALAFVELGRHAVPGPLVETVTAAVLLSGADPGTAERLLPALASGGTIATVGLAEGRTGKAGIAKAGIAKAGLAEAGIAKAGLAEAGIAKTGTRKTGITEAGIAKAGTGKTGTETSYALDGDAAGLRLSCSPDGIRLSPGHGPVRPSLDPARRLTPLTPGGELLLPGPLTEEALAWARLATAAQALGVGLALLDRTVAHVKRRCQFGVPVGSFQAVKHRLADAKIALEFARPLVFGAALTLRSAEVAAAKAAACEAAYSTARTALHLHGAIGYTAEYGLSLWLTKARALRTAWGDPHACRALVVSAAGDRRW